MNTLMSSPLASARVLPFSRLYSTARSSTFASSRLSASAMIAARARYPLAAHAGWAATAAVTAALTSSTVPRTAVPTSSDGRAGLRTSSRSERSSHSPSIRMRAWTGGSSLLREVSLAMVSPFRQALRPCGPIVSGALIGGIFPSIGSDFESRIASGQGAVQPPQPIG